MARKKPLIGMLPTITDASKLGEGKVGEGQLFKGPNNELFQLIGKQVMEAAKGKAVDLTNMPNVRQIQADKMAQLEQIDPLMTAGGNTPLPPVENPYVAQAKAAGFEIKPFSLPKGVGKGNKEEVMNKMAIMEFLRRGKRL